MSYPILYAENERDFASNGLGILSDAIRCPVVEELNGSYTLELEYPVGGVHFADIRMGSILLAKTRPGGRPQPFRVQDVSEPLQGAVTFYADHISYDLAFSTAGPFTAETVPDALQQLQAAAEPAHGFTFWTDKNTTAAMHVTKPTSVRALMGGNEGSVLDTYGGEFEFDRTLVRLWNRRGTDRGFVIRYGKNLLDLTQERNIRDTCSGLRPYWLGADDTLVELPEKILPVQSSVGLERVRPLDLSQEWQDPPTVEQLRARAEQYIQANKPGVPKVSLAVKFVQLSQSSEYRDRALLEQAELGDTVRVVFPRLGVEASARVISATYNVLLDRYDEINIGDARATLADTIAAQQQAIEQAPTRTAMQQAIDHQTKLITGNKGGYAVLHDSDGNRQPDEMLFMDTDSIITARQVLRINKSGIGFSSHGYDGPYDTAWTLDGVFNASFITTGTLNASLVNVTNLNASNIVTGTIRSKDGKNYINLDTGDARFEGTVYAHDGEFTGTVNANAGYFRGRIEATDGYFHGTIWANRIEVGGDAGYIEGRQVGSATLTGGNVASHTISGGNIGQSTVTGWNVGSSTITGGNIGGDTVARGNLVEKYATSAQYNSLASDVATIRNITTGTATASVLSANTLSAVQAFRYKGYLAAWQSITDGKGYSHTVLVVSE